MAKQKPKKADRSSAQKQRKARRKRRFFIRLAIMIAVAGVISFVAYQWNNLSPGAVMDGIVGLFSQDDNKGFPVNVSGSRIFYMQNVNGNTVSLSDTYVTMLDSSGGEVMRRAHAFSEPQLRTAGGYVLVSEQGGRRLQLESRSKTVLNLTVNYDIITTTVHKNGRIAVVTDSEQGYNATVSVYETDGSLMYQRLCSNLVVDVAFSPNGKQLAIATIGAEQGFMHSVIEVVSLYSDDNAALYSYSGTDSMLCRIQYLSDNLIAAVCDDAVWMYRPKKETCEIYGLTDGELRSFAFGKNSVAVLTQPYGSAQGGTLIYVKNNGTATYMETVEGECRDIAAYNDTYAVLTDMKLYQANSRGIAGEMEIPSDGRLVAVNGNRVVVLGLKSLSRYSVPNK